MFVTPEYLTIIYARQKYEAATARYNAALAAESEQSLVERNAAFSAECDALGIESQADDSERA